jgi:hypothetical protein
MSADPLPLLHKRTPKPAAVASSFAAELAALPSLAPADRPSDRTMAHAAAAGVTADAAWYDDPAEDALEDRISAVSPIGTSESAEVDEEHAPIESYVNELFAVPEGSGQLGALGKIGLRANDGSTAPPPSLSAESEAAISSSYIRVRQSDEVAVVQRFLEEIGAAQFSFTERLNDLERATAAGPALPSTEVARAAIAARLAELDHLRDALNDLYLEAAAPEVADALAQDGVFTEYLRGVYAWAESTLRALEVLDGELAALSPDWFRMRRRLTDARDFYLAHLEVQVRDSVEALNRGSKPEAGKVIRAVTARVDGVVTAAQALLKGVSSRFA